MLAADSKLHLMPYCLAVVVFTAPTSVATAQARGDSQRSLDKTVQELIEDLRASSYETRTAATRQLCQIGGPAIKALQEAARGSDAEQALRASAVLATLDRIFFYGVDVTLKISKTSAMWNEAVDLHVTFDNQSDYPAKLPFETDAYQRKALADHVRQMGDMLDIAEWLSVEAPDGKIVKFHLDDINEDPAVLAAVNQRVKGLPISVLPAQSRQTITIPEFNRGLARYRMLDEGSYKVSFQYVPQWEDAVLADAKVGRVAAPDLAILISKAAPPAVSRRGEGAQLDFRLEIDAFVVGLTNRRDRTAIINTNLGASAPFATGHWVYDWHGGQHRIIANRQIKLDEFASGKLIELAPGQSMEIARIDCKKLAALLSDLGADLTDEDSRVHFTYSNLCNRQWQSRQSNHFRDTAPDVLRHPMPLGIWTGRLSSSSLPLILKE